MIGGIKVGIRVSVLRSARGFCGTQRPASSARVAESVDAVDSKSTFRKGVPVRVRPLVLARVAAALLLDLKERRERFASTLESIVVDVSMEHCADTVRAKRAEQQLIR